MKLGAIQQLDAVEDGITDLRRDLDVSRVRKFPRSGDEVPIKLNSTGGDEILKVEDRIVR